MVLRTSSSLSVSIYSDSFPAMKPQRTCPCLGRKDGAKSCLPPCPCSPGMVPSLPWSATASWATRYPEKILKL